MFSFHNMVKNIRHSWTGKSLKNTLCLMGLSAPANVTSMYLHGESSEYIIAACLMVAQSGE